MKTKILIMVLVAIAVGAILMLMQPIKPVAQVNEATVAVAVESDIVFPIDNSPEVGNSEYAWLKNGSEICSPEFDSMVRNALSNDDAVQNTEYMIILRTCLKWIEDNELADAKNELKESLNK